jgi:hypothetical protein
MYSRAVLLRNHNSLYNGSTNCHVSASSFLAEASGHVDFVNILPLAEKQMRLNNMERRLDLLNGQLRPRTTRAWRMYVYHVGIISTLPMGANGLCQFWSF